jgi:GNAT superfamily N-acetyltransferase
MRPDEQDDVRALLTEAYQPYATVMGPEVYPRYLTGVLDTSEGRQLVAVDRDTVVGAARLYLPGHPTVRLPPDWAWVRAVGVLPSARGTGVGQAIMRHCAANAGEATALVLHTLDFMRAAIRLYERLGYERAPEYDFAARSGGWTAITYRLALTTT